MCFLFPLDLYTIILYRNAPHQIFHSDYFGHYQSSSAFIDKITCRGDENDVTQCSSVFHTACSTSSIVGLRCGKDNIKRIGGGFSICFIEQSCFILPYLGGRNLVTRVFEGTQMSPASTGQRIKVWVKHRLTDRRTVGRQGMEE